MRALVVVLGLAGVLSIAGCRVTVHDNHPPPRRTYVQQEVHVHDDGCGHCWDGGAWIHIGTHRHYHGCGHYWYGGRWCVHEERRRDTVIVEERPRYVVVEDRHVCHNRCNHYHDGARWVVVDRHSHGPGCGHVFANNRWTVTVRVR